MEYRPIRLEDVWEASVQILRERTQTVVAGVMMFSVLDFVSNLIDSTSIAVTSVVAQIMLQCMITHQLFGERDQRFAMRSYRTLVGASVVCGIAIFLGFALLFIPGLLLMSRWYLVTPLIVRDGLGVWPALQKSWDATRPSRTTFLALSILYLAAIAVWMGGGVLAAKLTGLGPRSPYLSVPTDLLGGVVVVGGWVTAVAAAQALAPSRSRLRSVFS